MGWVFYKRVQDGGTTLHAVVAIHAFLCTSVYSNTRAHRGEVQHRAAEQGQDKSQSCLWKDTLAALQYLQEQNSFSADQTL